MAVIFSVNKADNYFICKFQGRITDEECLLEWKKFLESDQWDPGLNELTDLSEADFGELTTRGLRNLATYIEKVYREHGKAQSKVATYAPTDLTYGISRMYSVYSEDSPEDVKVFKDKNAALEWLCEP